MDSFQSTKPTRPDHVPTYEPQSLEEMRRKGYWDFCGHLQHQRDRRLHGNQGSIPDSMEDCKHADIICLFSMAHFSQRPATGQRVTHRASGHGEREDFLILKLERRFISFVVAAFVNSCLTKPCFPLRTETTERVPKLSLGQQQYMTSLSGKNAARAANQWELNRGKSNEGEGLSRASRGEVSHKVYQSVSGTYGSASRPRISIYTTATDIPELQATT